MYFLENRQVYDLEQHHSFDNSQEDQTLNSLDFFNTGEETEETINLDQSFVDLFSDENEDSSKT